MGPLLDYYTEATTLAKDATGLTPDDQAKVIDKIAAMTLVPRQPISLRISGQRASLNGN